MTALTKTTLKKLKDKAKHGYTEDNPQYVHCFYGEKDAYIFLYLEQIFLDL